MKRALVVAAAFGCCAATSASSPVTALAGRYSHHFKNGDIDGDTGWSDDVLEIVPIDPAHAYFKLSLQFFNGHNCSLNGVATAMGDTLDFSRTSDQFNGATCHMSLYRSGDVVRMDDHHGSCQSTCGSRGGYRNATLSWKSRRRISYMALLKRSDDYQKAINEWKTGQ